MSLSPTGPLNEGWGFALTYTIIAILKPVSVTALNEGWGFALTYTLSGSGGAGRCRPLNEGWGFALTYTTAALDPFADAAGRSTKGGASPSPTPLDQRPTLRRGN